MNRTRPLCWLAVVGDVGAGGGVGDVLEDPMEEFAVIPPHCSIARSYFTCGMSTARAGASSRAVTGGEQQDRGDD